MGLVLVVLGTLAACGLFGTAALAAVGLSCVDACPDGPMLWPLLLVGVPLVLLVLMVLVARGVAWAALLVTAIGIAASLAAGLLATWPWALVGLPRMLGGTMVVSPLRHERR